MGHLQKTRAKKKFSHAGAGAASANVNSNLPGRQSRNLIILYLYFNIWKVRYYENLHLNLNRLHPRVPFFLFFRKTIIMHPPVEGLGTEIWLSYCSYFDICIPTVFFFARQRKLLAARLAAQGERSAL